MRKQRARVVNESHRLEILREVSFCRMAGHKRAPSRGGEIAYSSGALDGFSISIPLGKLRSRATTN